MRTKRTKRTWLTLCLAALMIVSILVPPSISTDVSAAVDHAKHRPQGMWKNPNVTAPYALAYDEQGREIMGSDHSRRMIGYFASWRTGKGEQPGYLVSDIPWDKITHINYAFAHIENNKISVGAANADNPAIGMEWPGVAGAEMDPQFSYKGHFNLFSKYKKQYPDVKTLVSVGGWAETGGYFDANGTRVANGGFYEMAKTDAGINTFADSCVNFLRTYGFDGIDIDYEYACSMENAGNPDDFWISNGLRGSLFSRYEVLMKTLREKLDQASVQDNKYYMLTVAAPSSGYLLRGMEVHQVSQYLDYVNIMSYDLHGAWNQFVGPNAALFDNGKDNELLHWNAYGGAYQNIGYLNTDWAYRYFRASMTPGRVNIGIPFYTRGWQGVTGGTNGLWGNAPLPAGMPHPPGTGSNVGSTVPPGYGAGGIDNIWCDRDTDGKEILAGANPMWHAKNLEHGIVPSYLSLYGITDTKLTGTYQRYYDSTLVAPWLWNAEKKVFLSTEDEESITAKVDYVLKNGIGGLMFWEMSGDYKFDQQKGEYVQGDTLMSLMYNRLKGKPLYNGSKSNKPMPTESVDIVPSVTGFKLGDQNYPLNPKLVLKNNTGKAIPGGTKFGFTMGTSAPSNISDQSGAGLKVVSSEHTGSNVGGLKGDFHYLEFTIPSWQSIPAGGTYSLDMNYYLPVSMPSNWKVTLDGKEYGFTYEAASNSVSPPTPTPVITTPTPATPNPNGYTVAGSVTPNFDYKPEVAAQVNAGFTVSVAGKTAVTDANGNFTVKEVPAGNCNVVVSKKNYLTRTQSNVNLNGNAQIATIEIWAGDLDGNGAINMTDVMGMVNSFNSAVGQPKYDVDKDFNKDGAINMTDIMIVVKSFNKVGGNYPPMSISTTPVITTPTPVITTPTPVITTPTPGTPAHPAWDAGKVYTGGDKVSYNGKNYQAKWWTQGETPGTSAVWQEI